MHNLPIIKNEIENERGCTMYITAERRVKPRIECEYQAVIEGTNGNGKKYQDDAKLVNLSASGLFLLLNRDLQCGSRISITIQLTDSAIDPEAPKLAINGIVVRNELDSSGKRGVAVKFLNYRFI